jgi:anti-sigma factor RsiW
MMTSCTDTQRIEQYLKGQLSTGERLLFEARMLTNAALRADVRAQKRVYDLVRLYQRKQVLQQAEAIHRQLFTDPAHADFQQSIHQLFH